MWYTYIGGIMAKVLILFFHPAYEKSRVNKRMIEQVQLLDHITLRDMYEIYPDFDIDVHEEQRLLTEHDVIIWHHPLFWYSCPPLMKQWIDLTLTHGWAYGSTGTALSGKSIMNVLTSGGPEAAYNGKLPFTLRQFLSPFEQTAKLCKMNYLPPYAVHGTHRLSEQEIDAFAVEYARLVQFLRDEQIDLQKASGLNYMNELFKLEITY